MVGDHLGLYVHWPWCLRKCPYCDFNSFAVRGSPPEDSYIDALLADLETASRDVQGRSVTSIFFGGGTPSLISAAGFGRLMDGIRNRVPVIPDAEITIEANPGVSETGRFAAYHGAGVNRFSIGVQSFNSCHLEVLGRIHSPREAYLAAEAALRLTGNVNLDLMSGLPGQTEKELLSDIDAAVSLAPSHISFYELTLEEGTAFGRRPPAGMPDPDTAAAFGETVNAVLAAAGFERYEVSAHARPGRRCRHNLTYWRYGDYLGIGAGAHGKVTVPEGIVRTVRSSNPRLYMAEVQSGRPKAVRRVVPQDEIPFEFMLNVLRLAEGVETSLWERRTGMAISGIEPKLRELRRRGLLVPDEGRIAATGLGMRFLSDIQECFLE